MAIPVVLAMVPTARALDIAVSPGLIIDFTFGTSWDIGIGFDFRVTALPGPAHCTSEDAGTGVGVYGKAMYLFRGDTPRVGAGLHGGFHRHPGVPSWDFEAGWLWQGPSAETSGGHGFEAGLLTTLLITDLGARFSMLDTASGWEPRGHLSIGGRHISPFGVGPWNACKETPF